jgi:hypothetical protein
MVPSIRGNELAGRAAVSRFMELTHYKCRNKPKTEPRTRDQKVGSFGKSSAWKDEFIVNGLETENSLGIKIKRAKGSANLGETLCSCVGLRWAGMRMQHWRCGPWFVGARE